MGIYTNAAVSGGTHIIAQSSLIKSTLTGHIWDCQVCSADTSGSTPVYTPIEVDNGVMVKVGGFTGNGLQERVATIAGVKDKVGFICSVPLVKDAMTRGQADESYFYHKAGQLARVYEIQGDEFDPDIIGVSLNAFTDASQANVAKDAYVILDGAGKYVAQASKPTASSYGFIGQVHSIQVGMNYTLVRIAVIQNVDNV